MRNWLAELSRLDMSAALSLRSVTITANRLRQAKGLT